MKYFRLILFCLTMLFASSVYSQYWKQATLPAPYEFNYWLDVYFLPSNPQYGWICGFQGMVVRTQDGGITWKGVSINGATHLESIQFVNEKVGYTSGTEGIFKSIDGGVTWQNITPTLPPNLQFIDMFWGSYFVDENDGMLLGGGCGGTYQMFLRTQDGGKSWSLFTASELNSGMTDPLILTKNGEGYATSSGMIWKTDDGGSTWSVFARTVSNPYDNKWQEEITKLGNSFLIPYAGNTCNGAGAGGGMYFSTDNGAHWNTYSVPEALFGAFLIDQNTGWVCGYNGEIYYTSNAGQSWELKNCGVNGGNLDDIWFINSTTGWVVGEGVYYLNPDTAVITKDTVDFGELCVPEEVSDTVCYINNSFTDKNISLSLTKISQLSDFNIIKPTGASSYSIQSCDSFPVVIKFKPTKAGFQNAYLNINIDNSNLKKVYISGTGLKSSVKAQNDTLKIRNATCSMITSVFSKWTAQYSQEVIDTFYKSKKTSLIWDSIRTPLSIYADTTKIKINTCPIDTGWIYANYKFSTLPCRGDSLFYVAVYGVSPIINLKTENANLECKQENRDSLIISNTGNSELKIESVLFSNNVNYTLDNYTFPIKLKVNETKTLFYNFKSSISGNFKTDVTIVNNDSTSVRGRKNPIIGNISTTINKAILSLKDTTIDIGKICLGDENKQNLMIRNNGNKGTIIETIAIPKDYYVSSSPSLPYLLAANETLSIEISFKPNEVRHYTDTLRLISKECNDTINAIINADVIKVDLDITPKVINSKIETNKDASFTVHVKSMSNEKIKIKGINLIGYAGPVKISSSPNPIIELIPNEEKDIVLIINSSKDTIINGTICFDIDADCPKCINLPILLKSYSGNIAFSQDSLDFGVSYCNLPVLYDTLKIKNGAQIIDSLLSVKIEPDNNDFSIVKMPNLPNEMQIGSSSDIIIKYAPQNTGKISAKFVLEFSNTKDIAYELPMFGDVRIPNTKVDIDSIDFGNFLNCDNIINKTVKFRNFGNVSDTLEYKDPFTDSVKIIAINSDDSNDILIKLNPSKITEYGLHYDTIKVTGKICPENINIIVKYYLLNDEFEVSPTNLIFSNVVQNDTVCKSIKIRNIGEVKLKLKTDMWNGTYFFEKDKSQSNIIINPKDSITVDLCFSSDKISTLTDSLTIVRDSCYKLINIGLSATVIKENLYAELYFGNYARIPGDTLTVELTFNGNLYKINADSINYQFSFDEFLYLPEKISVRNYDKFKTVNYEYNNGIIRGTIPKDLKDSLFNDKGCIMKIFGKVFFHNPNNTPIKIDKFEFITKKLYQMDLINGSLSLYGYCIPSGNLLNLEFNPLKKIEAYYSENKGLILEIETDSEIPINLNLIDVMGNTFSPKQINAAKGKSEVIINTTELSTGVYILEADTQFGRILMKKILIYK